MAENYPAKNDIDIDKFNRRFLVRTLGGAAVVLTGLALNKFSPESPIDEVLITLGAATTVVSGAAYAAGIVYKSTHIVHEKSTQATCAMPPRRIYGENDIPQEQHDAIRALIEKHGPSKPPFA